MVVIIIDSSDEDDEEDEDSEPSAPPAPAAMQESASARPTSSRVGQAEAGSLPRPASTASQASVAVARQASRPASSSVRIAQPISVSAAVAKKRPMETVDLRQTSASRPGSSAVHAVQSIPASSKRHAGVAARDVPAAGRSIDAGQQTKRQRIAAGIDQLAVPLGGPRAAAQPVAPAQPRAPTVQPSGAREGDVSAVPRQRANGLGANPLQYQAPSHQRRTPPPDGAKVTDVDAPVSGLRAIPAPRGAAPAPRGTTPAPNSARAAGASGALLGGGSTGSHRNAAFLRYLETLPRQTARAEEAASGVNNRGGGGARPGISVRAAADSSRGPSAQGSRRAGEGGRRSSRGGGWPSRGDSASFTDHDLKNNLMRHVLSWHQSVLAPTGGRRSPIVATGADGAVGMVSSANQPVDGRGATLHMAGSASPTAATTFASAAEYRAFYRPLLLLELEEEILKTREERQDQTPCTARLTDAPPTQSAPAATADDERDSPLFDPLPSGWAVWEWTMEVHAWVD